MKYYHSKMSLFAWLLLVAFAGTTVQMPAHAAMMSSQDIAAAQQLHAERHQLRERLLRDDVQAQLLELGVNPNHVEERIANLTYSELSAINGQLDRLPAGGNGLGTAALVLLILILLEVAGITDIFPSI